MAPTTSTTPHKDRALRFGLLALLVAAVVLFFVLGGARGFTLEALKSQQVALLALRDAQPVAALVGFFAVYVAVTALSLPGATLMTLAAGALFGLWPGVLLVSFASSIGATLAFLTARYLVGDVVRRRFGARLADIDAGVAREGALYLFTLRLVPLLPFFVINVVMGLTRMRVLTFYAVSQVGMFAATVVYVNAGTQLARIESLAGIVSPGLLGAFVLLGLFPLLARHGLAWARGWWQRRQLYAPWAHRRPQRYDRNMVVIGGGAAGLVSSYIAAAVKAKVTLVEAHQMGGDCLNTGCVPSKALIRSAKLMHQMRHSARYGIAHAEAQMHFADVMARVQQVVTAIAPHDSVERYTGLGVEVLQGHAQIIDPWHVQITAADGAVQTLSTRSIVIATGAAPVLPPLPGLQAVGVLTSETLWQLRELPARLLILGGGPIGCELAQAFARLGSAVTLVESQPRLLMREDEEVSAIVQAALIADGVRVLTGHRALHAQVRDTPPATALDPESKPPAGVARSLTVCAEVAGVAATAGAVNAVTEEIGFDVLLCAVGRAARLSGFGLDTLGIPVGRTIETNAFLQTRFPHILACGDVAGPYQLTHAAAHQAWYAAVNGLFGEFKRFKVDDRVMPSATFVDPEVARVGLNEQAARAQGVAYEVTRFDIADLDRAIADSAAQGFVKVLTVPGKDRILGVTIVGEHAGDLIAEYVLAMKHGLGLNKILATPHSYPTLAEANKYAAGEWKRAHAPQALLRWVARWHTWRRG